MYKIKNGILHKNGKKVFALGESYYPSFHPCKFPVPPEGDRMGEMKKDLKMMEEAGFNHVRFAALGDVSYDAENRCVNMDSPFVDAMIEEAEKNGLSASVRLQGFSVNLRGFKDADIKDSNGNIPNYEWSDFVRSTLNHEGILEDNFIYSRDLAKHYSRFSNVVGFQIYNEPKFPRPHTCICDYNPVAVKAFRNWLVEHNILTAQEAKNYQPPHSCKDQSPRMWALWRLFSFESMASFLGNASDGANAGADKPTFTCLTAHTACKTNPRKCVDAFANAKSMGLVGYTIYKHGWGSEYYSMCLNGDTFESAAAFEGKATWCIELDSRTYIPSSVYNKGTYTTIGSGVKGIIYYQWRGDCPVPGVPYPNSCGILNYDGTKTDNYDNAVKVNKWIQSVGDLLLEAHRANEGVGLFYSPYSVAYCDALENNDKKPYSDEFFNSSVVAYNQLYVDMRKAGYTVKIVDGEHLNKSGIKALVVPDMNHLSESERLEIERFYDNGGKVYVNKPDNPTMALPLLTEYSKKARTYEERVFLPPYTPYDLPDLTGIIPIAKSLDANIGVQTLEGEGYTLLVITNISPVKPCVNARICVNILFETAEFTAIDGSKNVTVSGKEVTVYDMTDGGILILRHNI